MKNAILFLLILSSSLFASCPFCNPKVIEKQLVAESKLSYVLYCLTPATDGNLLIIPKRHITRFEELHEEEVLDLYRFIQKVQDVFKNHYEISDYLLVQKNGINAGQSVDHIHIHAIPCPQDFDKGSVFLYRPKISDCEMKECCEALRKEFD